MANSTSNIDQISSTQANKEVVVNANMNSASPALCWGQRASTTVGLTWGYYGGYYNGNAIANGTLTLSASSTNYVEANASTGAVTSNTSGFTGGRIPLYTVVTGASTITSWTDLRNWQPTAVGAVPGSIPYDVAMFMPGIQTSASQIMARIIFNRAVSFPSGSGTFAASANKAATGSTTFTIRKNGSSIGTLVWAGAGTVPTVTFSSTTAFAVGDVLSITGPAVADATLADISVTMSGLR